MASVSTTPAVNFSSGTAGVVDTGGKFTTLSCEYFRKLSKKFETTLMGYSGAWGKLIFDEKPEVENLVALSL